MKCLETIIDERLARLEQLQADANAFLAQLCRLSAAVEGHLYVASVALLHHALATGELPETIERAEGIRQSREG